MQTVKKWFSVLAVVAVVASIASSPSLASAAGDQRQAQATTGSTWLLTTASDVDTGRALGQRVGEVVWTRGS